MKKIKEISLWTSYAFYGSNIDQFYKDKLRVSRHWISYERTPLTKEETCAKWSYKTDNKTFEDKFDSLCECLERSLNVDATFPFKTDCGSFSIRIFYEDDTYDTQEFFSSFQFNRLNDLADAFMAIIPNNEIFPDLLNCNELGDANKTLLQATASKYWTDKNFEFTEKESEALTKLYIAVGIGFECWAMQNNEIYNVLCELFERMGFESMEFKEDRFDASNMYYREKNIGKMIEWISKLTYKQAGNFLYATICWRKVSDAMGGQFSREFDTFLIYLLNVIFDRRSSFSVLDMFGERFFWHVN